jgi:hypothetical protein
MKKFLKVLDRAAGIASSVTTGATLLITGAAESMMLTRVTDDDGNMQRVQKIIGTFNDMAFWSMKEQAKHGLLGYLGTEHAFEKTSEWGIVWALAIAEVTKDTRYNDVSEILEKTVQALRTEPEVTAMARAVHSQHSLVKAANYLNSN